MKTDGELAKDGHDIGYLHYKGICGNPTCLLEGNCKDEVDICDKCDGIGYYKKDI